MIDSLPQKILLHSAILIRVFIHQNTPIKPSRTSKRAARCQKHANSAPADEGFVKAANTQRVSVDSSRRKPKGELILVEEALPLRATFNEWPCEDVSKAAAWAF